MGRKNSEGSRKRKSVCVGPSKRRSSPPAKRRTTTIVARPPTLAEETGEELHGLQQWLRHPAALEPVVTTSIPVNQVTVEAEIHSAPSQSHLPETVDHSDSDTIDIALGIARETASVKADIKRVEELISNNRITHSSEHEALVVLLSSIQDHVCKIDTKAMTLEDKLLSLSHKVTAQEAGLNKAQRDIETLCTAVSKLEERPNGTTQCMEVDESSQQAENTVVINNMPDHNKDEEDVRAMFYIGLCLDSDAVEIKNIKRNKSTHENMGNLMIELGTLEQKRKILRHKHCLRSTKEYSDVYIRPFKSSRDIITELNFSTILNNLHQDDLMMASNGKIIRRHTQKRD